MKTKIILSLTTIAGLTACSGGGGGNNNPTIPEGPEDRYLSELTVATSSLYSLAGNMSSHNQNDDVSSVYDAALVKLYNSEHAKYDGHTEHIVSSSEFLIDPHYSTILSKETQDWLSSIGFSKYSEQNDFNSAKTTYSSFLNMRLFSNGTNKSYDWSGTYTGSVVARNYTGNTSPRTYNWIDKGTTSVTLVHTPGNSLTNATFAIDLENHADYNLSTGPSYNGMFFTDKDDNIIKSIVGALSYSEINGSKTYFNYSVHK